MKLIFIGFGWLVVGLAYLLPILAAQIFEGKMRLSAVPSIAWIVLSILLFNPIWRYVWKKVPKLNLWFPDLNGEWDVVMCTNWPRQQQLMSAALDPAIVFDMKHAAEENLAPLEKIKLKACITQTWWSFHMTMTNPSLGTPIKRSDTIMVDPFGRKDELPAGICYFYKQQNATDTVSDDNEFFGAARLEYNPETDTLEGLVWTARMWRRAMNTAGDIKFTRSSTVKRQRSLK